MLIAGIAELNITPTGPCDLAGYAAREQPCEGVHDPVFARALAFRADAGPTIALVVCETLGFDPETDARIRARVRAEAALDGVLLAATHTHAAPASMTLVECGTSDPAWIAWLEEQLQLLARTAVADLAPVICRRSRSECGMAMNRRATIDGATRLLTEPDQRPPEEPPGPTDPEVQSLELVSPGGAARALLFHYTCHPVALGAQNRLISADWPVFAAQEIQASGFSAPVMFAQGCCGDINPRIACRGFEETERAGREVGQAVVGSLASGVEAPVPRLAFAEAELDLPIQDEHGTTHVNLAAAALGPEVGIVTLPGEAFVELGLQVKAASPFAATLVLGYANANVGYLPTRSAYPLGGYEVDSAWKYYGYPAAFAPEAGESVVATATDLLARCAREVGSA